MSETKVVGKVDLLSDPTASRWFSTIVRDSTKHVYKSALKRYVEFTGLTPKQLIEEALEDTKKPVLERQDIVKKRLLEFYTWLKTEAPVKKRRKVDKDTIVTEVVGKGLSDKMAHTYVNAIRSFYATFDIVVKFKGRSRLPKPKVTTRRLLLKPADVKRLIDHAPTLRDRAIILVMFQSGIDVSTLCSLKYKDVKNKLEDHPLKLDLVRGKTGVEYYTFLGRDATEALKAYLNDLKAKGINLGDNDPLFVKYLYDKVITKDGKEIKKPKPIKPHNVQVMLREVAKKAGFINGDERFNPVSPHALRESFSSILVSNKVPTTIVDFFLGHELGELARAYQRVEVERLRQIYLEVEKHLSIVQPPTVIKEIEERLRNQIERQNMIIQSLEARLKRMEAFLFKVLPGATDEDLDLLRQRYEQRVMNEIQDYKKQQANPSVD